jgi:uncharacterized coiled-coil protein SlyX
MAAPWSSLIGAIPWSEVINHAPRIAQGARKLWKNVKGEADADGADNAHAPGTPPQAEDPVMLLLQRIDHLEQTQAASAELLAQLAQQNAELVQRLEQQGQSLRRLQGALGALALLTVPVLGYLLLR